MQSSSARILPIRCRGDLQFELQSTGGESWWAVKDPIALKYYRLPDEEAWLLRRLDGSQSLVSLKRDFEMRFAPMQIGYGELQRFLGRLHQQQLVVSHAGAQASPLVADYRQQRGKKWLGYASNILAIRFRGFNPRRILNVLTPLFGWFFTPWAACLVLIFAASAGLLVLTQWDTFRGKLPAFHEFFGPKNWITMFLVLSVTKVIHEFGHGICCRKQGSDCHEIGAMLLVLTPALYCDTSDSWMLQSKWRRAAIAAAGMYVEIFLAAVATFIWWNSTAGWLNYIALQVMFVCSVTTLLFNGNPLLRYDGYYILSDLAEVPNLRQRCTQTLQYLAMKYCLGMDIPENASLPRKNRLLFAGYTVASFFYRWFVVFSILWFLTEVLEPYGLKVVGQMLAIFSLVSMVVMPLFKFAKFLRTPGRVAQMKRRNLIITGVATASVLLLFVGLPLPHYEYIPGEVASPGAETLNARAAGRLVEVKKYPGDSVAAGDTILVLENEFLSSQLREKQHLLEQYQARVDFLGRHTHSDRTAFHELAVAETMRDTTQNEVNELQRKFAQLEVKAPKAGIVEELPRKSLPADSSVLAQWSGKLFSESNIGCFLEEREEICRVVPASESVRVNAYALDHQVDLIESPADVWLTPDSMPMWEIPGRIEEKSSQKAANVPPALALRFGGPLDTESTQAGERPRQAAHLLRIAVADVDTLPRGSTVRVRVFVGYRTAAQRSWRWFQRQFKL